ncbi:MAG: hypothetical protein QM756_39885 [Polyangiaceae bacterium]
MHELVDVARDAPRKEAIEQALVTPEQAVARFAVARTPMADQAHFGGFFGFHAGDRREPIDSSLT